MSYQGLIVNRVWPLVDRAYRESVKYTWTREATLNAIEAGATQIEFGIEWQAVKSQGVYRRIIADNGSGMSDNELEAFMKTFGGGGKAIGEIHENYGVGFKTSVLSWNPEGVIVVSWKDGIGSMIRIRRYGTTSADFEFGLEEWSVEDDNGVTSLSSVIDPEWDDELGCDLSKLRPEWMKDSDGTVILLLGQSLTEDTVLGDTKRGEGDVVGIQQYMNRRFWTFPEGFKVRCMGPMTKDKTTWEIVAKGAKNIRNLGIYGALYEIEQRKPSDQGMVLLPDGTRVCWYLCPDSFDEKRDARSYIAGKGYTCGLYKDEIYDLPGAGPARAARQRNFGVGAIQERVWLVLEPPHYSPSQRIEGVSPTATRTRLEWNAPSTGDVAGELPWYSWGKAFMDLMPAAIAKAVDEARSKTEPMDEDFKIELDKKFSGRWRAALARVRTNLTTNTVDPDGIVKPRGPSGEREGRSVLDPNRVIRHRTRKNFNPRTKKGSDIENPKGAFIPEFKWVSGQPDTFDPGMIASYSRNVGECGTIYLNLDHSVIKSEIGTYCATYPESEWDSIEKFVTDQYGQLAVTAVAHAQCVPDMSDPLRNPDKPEAVEKGVLSPAAITMTMLGIKAQEAVIRPGLGGKFGRRREESAA